MDKSDTPGLRVLIAEPHRTVAGSLARLIDALGPAQITAVAHTATDAIEVAEKIVPDVAIVDLALSPNCSLVTALRALYPQSRVVVLGDRGPGETEGMVKALASGAVGAIYKGSTPEELARALQHSSEGTPVVAAEATGVLLRSYVEALGEKRQRDLAVIEALAAAVEARDMATAEHLDRVTKIAQACMARIDESLASNEEVRFGFMLHDVGKIGVPDAILHKPGPLDTIEWDVMRRHPEMGVRIVEPIGFSSMTTDVILCHHERWDGSGYPRGLSRDEIPLVARVFSVADAFDAMTSDRPYRGAMEGQRSLEVLRAGAGSVFDPEVVDVFIDLSDRLAAVP